MRMYEIESAISKKQPLPREMTVTETIFALMMKQLYANFFAGNISRNDASMEKRIIIMQSVRIDEEYQNWQNVHREHQDNIRLAGTLLSDIIKSQDLKEVALLSCKVISLMTGDELFYKTMKGKIND